MKSHNTIAGKIYTVTSPSGCTVTDETGLQLGSVEAGEQKSFVATGAQLSVDDDAARVTLTFKRAALALRLLGGGVKSELPAGYLRAEFLESTGTQYIQVAASSSLATAEMRAVMQYAKNGTRQLQGYSNTVWFECNQAGNYKLLNAYAGKSAQKKQAVVFSVYEITSKKSSVGLSVDGREIAEIIGGFQSSRVWTLFALWTEQTGVSYFCNVKIWLCELRLDSEKFDLIPCMNANGEPAMYDKFGKKAYTNGGSGQFIVGFTLAQARKLGAHLPAGGGKLTVSLPTGYEQDSAVAESLETARAKGWTLTVQTYEAEAAATTFGMRRVWVRRTQDEHGAYVDADGVRWAVDWCVDMLTPDGSKPGQHGYELYRSTEAAVAYWELAPWVDPEAEELLTTESL